MPPQFHYHPMIFECLRWRQSQMKSQHTSRLPVLGSIDTSTLLSATPRASAIAVVKELSASSTRMSSGMVISMVPVVTYSMIEVKSELSTPYASATRASKSSISDESRGLVVGLEISTETTNPMNDGAPVGACVIGVMVGNFVGDDVTNI
eukprot:UN23306